MNPRAWLVTGIALANLILGLSAHADQNDITITLPGPEANDLHNQLANARPPMPLEVLGLEGVAEYLTVVPVPMRDGVRLSANIILPRGAVAQKLPVILIRTPYTPSSELSEPLAPPLDRKSVV